MYYCNYKTQNSKGCSGGGGGGARGPQGAQGAQGAPGGGGGGGGDIFVGYYQGDPNGQDVSAIYFDESGFDLSYGSVYVTNKATNYLFNQPDSPKDMSANFITGNNPFIEISFNIPDTAKLAGTIYQNSPTVFYKNNNNENWLPAMNNIKLDISYSGISGWLTLINSLKTPQPDARITKIRLYNSGSSSGLSGTYPNRIYDYVDSNNILFGYNYDFRLAYVNNSEDSSFNYSTASASFGAFGPSNQPTSIQFNSTDYNNLTLSGVGSSTIDASLNFSWNLAPPPYVGYGANWKANKNDSLAPNGFKQVGGNTVSYTNESFTFNIPNGTGTDSTKQNWGPKDGSLAGKIHPEYYYQIDISGANSSYYQEITSGSFGPTYAANSVTSQKLLPIPARTSTNYGSNDYLSVLGSPFPGTSMTSILKNSSGQTSLTVLTRSRGTNNYNEYTVDFLDNASTISYTYDASSVYKYLANYGDRDANPTYGSSPVTNGSYIGIDSSGVQITNFETQIKVDTTTAYTIQDVSTVAQYGWAGNSNDGPRSITTAPFNLNTSSVKDIDLTSNPNLEGYYLGVDVSNIKLDVTLNQFEDVSNNSYNNYRWRVVQNLKRNDGLSDESSFLYYDFRIGLLPSQNIAISPLTVAITNPTLPSANYFGLKRPELTLGNRPTVNISYTLNNINPDWAPPSSQNTLATFNFYIDPNNIVNDILLDTTTKTWSSDLNNKNTSFSFNESYPITYNSSDAGDYNSVPYSRALGTNSQFGSKINGNIYSNNVTRSPSTNTYWTAANNAEISFNSLPLWWDFVWNNTNDLRSTRLSYLSNPTGALLNITGSNIDCSLNNAGSGISPSVGGGGNSDPWVAYDHSNTLPDNQLMISSGQIISGNNSNIQPSLNPYIDYSTAFFGNLSNYQSKDTSGDTVSWSYGSNIFYNQSLTPVTSGTIKWFVIKIDNPNTLNTNNNSKFVINDGSTLLILGTDYILFYMEEDYNGSNGAYTVNTVGRYYTPWMDCANTSLQSNLIDFTTAQQTLITGLPAGTGNGAYDNTNINGFPIRKFGGTNRVYQYYRIGLFNGDNQKITKITITYG